MTVVRSLFLFTFANLLSNVCCLLLLTVRRSDFAAHWSSVVQSVSTSLYPCAVVSCSSKFAEWLIQRVLASTLLTLQTYTLSLYHLIPDFQNSPQVVVCLNFLGVLQALAPAGLLQLAEKGESFSRDLACAKLTTCQQKRQPHIGSFVFKSLKHQQLPAVACKPKKCTSFGYKSSIVDDHWFVRNFERSFPLPVEKK